MPYEIPGVGLYPAELPNNYQQAVRIKQADFVNLSQPNGWNPNLPLAAHQQIAAAWLYFAQKAILADSVGCGKTGSALGLIQLLKSRNQPYRSVIVVPKSVQRQWVMEIERFTNLSVSRAFGTKAQRIATYGSMFEVLLLTYNQLLRDYDPYLRALQKDVVVFDEGSYIRHHQIKTARVAKAFSSNTPRVILLDGTPIQTALTDLHSEMEVLHIQPPAFPPLPGFEMRYVRRAQVQRRHGNSWVSQSEIVGYQNIEEFKLRLYPYILRRRAADIADDLPEVVVENVWLELPAEQRRHYDNARRGFMELLHEGRDRIRLDSSMHTVQQALDSTIHFGERNPQSVKLDRIMELLTGDLQEEKVVIFAHYKATIVHLMQLLRAANIPAARFTGDEGDDQRAAIIKSFNDENGIRVLCGTEAIERGLNLQISAYLININQMYNPSRMQQLAGRIQRMGSTHTHVFVLNLLCIDTIEERLLDILRKRAAVPSKIFEEESDLFSTLTYEEMAMLMAD